MAFGRFLFINMEIRPIGATRAFHFRLDALVEPFPPKMHVSKRFESLHVILVVVIRIIDVHTLQMLYAECEINEKSPSGSISK